MCPAVAAALVYYEHVYKKITAEENMRLPLLWDTMAEWTPQLVKGAWNLQKGMSLKISTRKTTRLQANMPPNVKKMHD